MYSTRAKLLAVLVPVIALATLATLGGLSLFLEDFFQERMTADAIRLAEALKASLKQQMLSRLSGPAENVTQRTLEDIGGAGDIRSITIVDRAGRVGFAYPASQLGRVLEPTREGACQPCHAGQGRPVTGVAVATEPSGERILKIATPIANEPRCQVCHGAVARNNGVLVIERAMSAEQAALGTIRRRFTVTWTLTLAVVSVLIAGVTTAFVHRPVQRLIEATRRVGAGDLTARVTVPGRGELGELAASFNTMAGNLASSLHDVRQKNVELSVLYNIVDRVSRIVFVGELKPLILDVVGEVLRAPKVMLVSRGEDPGQLEILERPMAGSVVRRVVGDDQRDPAQLPVAMRTVDEWLAGRLTDITLDTAAGVAMMPLRFADHDLALLVVATTARELGPDELRLMGAVRDHISVALENARLYTLAITDELTQLWSLRYFQAGLVDAAHRFERYGEPMGLLMLDLDHFKRVNDTYGHPAGDLVLREVGRRIRASVRAIDKPCRYGGEEFGVILPRTDARSAFLVAERIRAAIADSPFRLADGVTITVTASIGVSACPQHATTPRDLVTRADQGLYLAKRGGRNQVRTAGDQPASLDGENA